MSETTRRDFIKALCLTAGMTPALALTKVDNWLQNEWGNIDFENFKEFRNQFMLDDQVNYLNHASIGTMPKTIHKAHTELLALCESNPWLHMWGGEWEQPRENVRAKAAQFINAKPTEIAFAHNTTEVNNLLAMGLPLGNGDEVLFSNLNHAGASLPYEFHANRKGYKVIKIDIPFESISKLSKQEVIDLHIKSITPNTKLLVLPHIDNTVGLRTPVKEIVAQARQKGVEWITLDTAQSAGMIPLDVRELDIDVMSTSAHKWLQTPKGVSYSYIRENMLDVIKPMWVTWGQTRWEGSVRIFEDYGTRNLAEVLTLGAAIDFHSKTSWKDREKHFIRLRDFAMEKAKKHNGAEWKSSYDWELSGSLYAVGLNNEQASDFAARIYRDQGIVVRPFDAPGLNSIRIAPNLMNTDEDIEKLFAQIK